MPDEQRRKELTSEAEQGLTLLKVRRYLRHSVVCVIGAGLDWREGDASECNCGLAALVQAIDQGRSAEPMQADRKL